MTVAVNSNLVIFEAMRQIIIHELGLAEDRVYVANQKFIIPTDEHLFIYLDCLPAKIISSRSAYEQDPVTGDYQEVQSLNLQDPVNIGVFSKNLEAFERKEEVVMALYSHYAQQLQEQYSFRIFRNAPIEDLTTLEGAAMLYRYDIPVMLFTTITKTKTVDFYDAFRVKVSVNDGLPLVEKEFDQPTI